MKAIIFILLVFLLSTTLYAEIPELIGVIKSDTHLTQFGRRIVPLGDQSNDGFDDFITWRYGNVSYIFYGGNPIDTICDLKIDSVLSPYNVQDINGDAYDDFVCPRKYNGRWKLALFYGGSILDSLPDFTFGADTMWGSLAAIRSHDINFNGTDEIICRHYDQMELLFYELTPILDSIPDIFLGPPNLIPGIEFSALGDAIISGDFNGDSFDDLGVNFRPRVNIMANGEVWLYWGGPDFDTIPDMKIKMPREYAQGNESFGKLLENLGDVNGDGFDDIFAGPDNSFDSLCYVFFGGPGIDTIPDVSITYNCTQSGRAGDINNDGYNDLITSFPVEIPSLGRVYIYLGGPDMDSIPDVVLTESAIDGSQNYWGNDVTGVGDINGDGLDDFAFSALESVTIANRGVIYIYSGWQDPVDVEYDYQPIIPDNFQLHQNYPNPFNLSTNIEFEIPTRQSVTLCIYDILGREIRQLIDKSLTAGKYKINWDGLDDLGQPAPSGIYLYRLETESSELSKKMILLK